MRNCKAQRRGLASDTGGRNELGILYRKTVLLVEVIDTSAELSLIPSWADLSGEPNLRGAIDGADGETEQVDDGLVVCEAVSELVFDDDSMLELALGDMLDHIPASGT